MFGYRSRFLRVMVLWASTRYTTGSRSFAGTVGDLLARSRSPPSIPVKAEVTVTGGEGCWKPAITLRVHLDPWLTVLKMFSTITFGIYSPMKQQCAHSETTKHILETSEM